MTRPVIHPMAQRPSYRAPQDCPVCGDHLDVTRLGCPSCGTGLTGEFRTCEFCGLDDADRALLRVFLVSRGNMKDVERHLAVSYPTARARFDDLLRRIGYLSDQSQGNAAAAEPINGPISEPAGEPDPRLDTLRALASGALDVGSARQRLTR